EREVLQGDILESNIKLPKKYKVVANVPYYITSPIIRMFLENNNPPALMVLMVQKEVAQRICQKPPEMSLLAVSVQYYAMPKIAWPVSKGCFWPSPNVDSAIISITPQKRMEKIGSDAFFQVVKAGFSHPRKQLLNNLSTALGKSRENVEAWLLQNNLSPLQRAETLNVQDWINLTRSSPD
ncbi:16S rRNA (adenine(1518)-N(6)/adenine(1519)-N(6))-dimethyltransferase, partial [Candidatus Parcubacteria bacterium]|nr:16S rRNA (adenine(1518)-N(6)/adenine(1519)-N(6))-dimethyltransferase [Candidatus Parcubacteria bacterium]